MKRVLALVVLAAAGCGHAPPPRAVATPTPIPLPADWLGAPVSYDEGMTLFAPAPGTTRPRRSAEAAYRAESRMIANEDLLQYSSPVTRFALYTHYGEGAMGSSGDLVRLAHYRQPVWFTVFENVPVMPSGPGCSPGRPCPQRKPVREEVVFAVDDLTGRVLVEMDDVPDKHAMPRP